MGFQQRQVAQNVSAGTVGNDAAGSQQDGSGAEFEHHFEVMGGDEPGACQFVDQLDQAAAGARVEVGGGFIKNEHRWIACQHAREAGALAFTEAEMMGRSLGLVSERDPFQAIEGDSPGIGPALAQVERPERDIVDDRIAEKLVIRVLEHQADKSADRRCVLLIDLQTVDRHARFPSAPAVRCRPAGQVVMSDRPAGVAGQKSVQMQQERALARPIGADNRDRLAALYPQLDPASASLPSG